MLKIKEIREQKNLTQDEVVHLTGIPKRSYVNYENETTDIPLKKLQDIANGLNVSVGELIGESKKLNVENNVLKKNEDIFEDIFEDKPNVEKNVLKPKKGDTLQPMSDKMKYLQSIVDKAKAKSSSRTIPLYGVSSIGGTRDVADVDTPITEPEAYIEVGGWFPDATEAGYHYGDSMKEYPSGCILILKRIYNLRSIVWGSNYVVETNEIRVTKRLQTCKDDDNCIMAYSSNKERYEDGTLIYEPFKIYKEDIRTLLLVVASINREQMTSPMKLIQVKK